MFNIETMVNMLNQIRKYYACELNQRFKDYSPNEISILLLLSNNPSIDTNGALRLVLNVSKGLISRSVVALMKKDLLVCVQDEKDKRIQHLYLSPQAIPVLEEMQKEILRINDVVFKDLDENEIKAMEKTMIKIMNHFKEKGVNVA